jgi:RNA polymerase sigma-70 factor (ECF subfamily)
MARESELHTGTTLLVLLRDYSDQAWQAFVDRYGPRIYHWCRGWRLQEADAENVTQEVLIKLYQKLRAFRYDRSQGSFRSWLKTVAHHAWQDYLDSQRRLGATGAGGSAIHETINAAAAGADLWEALKEAFDLELLEEAKARVRLQVSERDWQIFQELALQGRSGAEVAAARSMSVAAVFMARSRVQQKLKETVQMLEEDGPGGSA